ncbi:MAG: hypothetical protein ACM3O6_08710 [Acidobacteriota bacterium]
MADGEAPTAAMGTSLEDEIRMVGAVIHADPLVAFHPQFISDAATLHPGSMAFQMLMSELGDAKVRLRDWRAAVDAARDCAEHEPSPAPRGSNGVAHHHEAEEARDVDERPTIRVVADQLPAMVDELRDALARHDENLFTRGGELVTVAKEPERREPFDHARRKGRSIVLRPGTPRITAMPFNALVLRAAEAANWQQYDRKSHEWVGARPDPLVVGAFRDSESAWAGLPPLRGLAETPFLAPSGRIVSKAGYDEETAYMLLPTCDPGPIPEHPTPSQCEKALQYLWTESACDIPFRGLGEPDPSSDPDRLMQWLAAKEIPDAFIGVCAVLTLVGRPAILGAVPGLVFEAAGQGSGKSLQMHAVSTIATGRAAAVMNFPMKDGRADEQELEKVLGACALADSAIIAFDNIRGSLGGPALELKLTAKKESAFRILGVSERRVLPWRSLIMFSINNATMNDDMANRVLMSRVESPREDPRSRPASSFRHPELLDALERLRPRLVRAALVILRGYWAARAAGEVDTPPTMGSFEAWSRLVPPAIRWAGGPDVLRARPEAGSGSDEETEAHATLLRCWPDAWNGQRSHFVLGEAFRLERDIAHGKAPDDGYTEIRGAIRSLTRTPEGRLPGPQGFGIALRKLLGRPRNGARLARAVDAHTKVATWSVQRMKSA